MCYFQQIGHPEPILQFVQHLSNNEIIFDKNVIQLSIRFVTFINIMSPFNNKVSSSSEFINNMLIECIKGWVNSKASVDRSLQKQIWIFEWPVSPYVKESKRIFPIPKTDSEFLQVHSQFLLVDSGFLPTGSDFCWWITGGFYQTILDY